MKFTVIIEKSFEGEYRAIVRNSNDYDIITMPWIVGDTIALRQLGKLFTKKSPDIYHALQTDVPLTNVFINATLKDTR